MKVLVVEDEIDLRNVMREVLESFEVQVYEAAHGEEALTVLSQHQFQAVICDC